MRLHSLSSYSFVRGSLKIVTAMSLLSGMGQTTIPFKGFFMVGSHMRGSVVTLRLRRLIVTDNFFGCLNRNSIRLRVKDFAHYNLFKGFKEYHFDVASTVNSSKEITRLNLAARLLTLWSLFQTELIF